MLRRYEKNSDISNAKKIAGMLCRSSHLPVITLLGEKIREAASVYPDRDFGRKQNKYLHELMEKAERRKEELEAENVQTLIYREEPFIYDCDSISFQVYLMIVRKGVWKQKIKDEKIKTSPNRNKEGIIIMDKLLDLTRDFDTAKAAFEAYLDEYDRADDKIHLKIVHTYGVGDAAEDIARRMGLDEEDVQLAKVIGSLHDIGRFEQIKRFDSFEPGTMEHAVYGAQLIYGKKKLIARYVKDTRFAKLK